MDILSQQNCDFGGFDLMAEEAAFIEFASLMQLHRESLGRHYSRGDLRHVKLLVCRRTTTAIAKDAHYSPKA